MARLTVLNGMVGSDIAAALNQHVVWGLSDVDLRDSIFGKAIADISLDEAKQLAEMLSARRLSVYCFSTTFFYLPVEDGPDAFRAQAERLGHVLQLAQILKPTYIRLLSAQIKRRAEIQDSNAYLKAQYAWVLPLYAEAVDKIAAAGFKTCIENELHSCIFGNPSEIVEFFRLLDRPGKACLTWDVANLWQHGTYPSREVFRVLRPLMGYYHLKGGRSESGNLSGLKWMSALDDSSWPVTEITREVMRSGVSPVICLNPPHGSPNPAYDYRNVTARDVTFAKKLISGV